MTGFWDTDADTRIVLEDKEEPKEEDDENEEEEEEEDEDDDDDDIEVRLTATLLWAHTEGPQGQPSRKRRRRQARRNQFIDVEAEVDDEDDEEPEEEDDLPGDEMHPDDFQELPPGADRDDRKHRELDRQRDMQMHVDAEEEALRLKEKYGRQVAVGDGSTAITDKRLLMPGPDDPRIFRMKCRPGHEREIIAAIQQRIVDRMTSREPVKIISVFAREGAMAGNLYIESRLQDYITPAVDGISHVFMGTKPFMVPVEEMPDLLHTRRSKQLEPGMYVRVKRGLYQGDLAQIEEVEANNVNVTVRLVPRLDYGLIEDANAMQPDQGNGVKRKRPVTQRPAQKLFSESEARKKHSRHLQRIQGLSNNSWTYMGKDYINGLLSDTYRIGALQTEDVSPTLEEVTKFAAGAEDGTENLDLVALAATLKQSTADDFVAGDKVTVFRGEQKGVLGQAVQVYGDVVKIRVEEGALRGQTIEAPAADLRKLFREGDHVKVIGGSKYFDEVGMVVKIRDDRVTLLTDSNQQEITVFSKDLREASDSGGVVGKGMYDLFDLVQLDVSTVGCVVKVDRESLRVLDQNGSVRALLPTNIANKIDKRPNAIATDHDGNEIKLEDTIREYSGEQKQGRVLHIHRNYVFAQNRERSENGGIFVTRTSNVITVAAKGGRVGNGGVDLTKMNPAMRQNGGSAAVMAPPQARGRDRLIGRTVRIKQGPQKGMIGIVKDTTDDMAMIELHAKNKKVQVAKAKLVMVDPNTGAVIGDAGSAGAFRGALPSRGPLGSQTPARGFGGAPLGSQTPAYAMTSGGRTPTWKQDAGARTPAYGATTAYGGQGGSTAYGGQTSYGGATSYGGGSVWGGNSGVSLDLVLHLTSC